VKRRAFTAGDYSCILETTREYYRAYKDQYIMFYENWAKGKAEFSGSEYVRGYETVAKILSDMVRADESVVDTGCGVGRWSTLLAEGGAHVTSIDYLSAMLQHLTQTCRKRELQPKISPVVSDGFYLPFTGDAFDGATLNWVLSHIPVTRNRQFLNEVRRVVRDGGWLFISDSYWRGQEGGKEQVHTRQVSGKPYEVYKYYYEPGELVTLLQKTFGAVKHVQPLHYELICVTTKRRVGGRENIDAGTG